MTYLCVPITSSTVSLAKKDIIKANKLADIIELRLDFIEDIDEKKLRLLIKQAKKPVIVTHPRDTALLKKVLGMGVQYIDLDLNNGSMDWFIKNKRNTKIICSYHNFSKTPGKRQLKAIYAKMMAIGCDIIKIVGTAKSVSDNLEMFELLKHSKKPMIALCMGKKGEVSRLLAGRYASFLTFGSLGTGKESAPGQIPVEQMKNLFRADKITHRTKVYAVLGNPIQHSLSPYIHNIAFQKNGLDCIYIRLEMDSLQFLKSLIQELDIRGISVTMPFKKSIMKHLDIIDADAKRIDAVNTVINRNGKLIGFNTDYVGAVKALEEKTAIRGKRIVILGAGGAAGAVAYGIRKKGGSLTILNRTVAKARVIAKKIGCDYGSLDRLRELHPDIIINTTSVGMHEDKSLVDKRLLKKGMVVMDLIYSPANTRLLKDAKKKGCITINGVPMLFYQAMEQFRLFTGKRADEKAIRKCLLDYFEVKK